MEKNCENCRYELVSPSEYPCDKCKETDRFEPKETIWRPIGQYPTEPSLLCFTDGYMSVGFYDYEFEHWTISTGDGYETDLEVEEMHQGEPIAWMPLPKPYKESED